MGVDDRQELTDVGEVAQGLDAPAGGARPDRDQDPGGSPDLLDPLGVAGCGDGALNEADVIGPVDHGPCGFREVGNLDPLGHREQLVLAVEQGELAAVARGELPDRQGRARRCRPWLGRAGVLRSDTGR